MAITKSLTIGSTANSRPYGILTVTETATSTANNTSTLSIKLVLKRPSAISSSASKSANCTINGTKYTWSGSIGGSGDLTLISKTQTVTHNTDGTKTINIAASIALNITWSGVSLGTISNSGTMTLTAIPRYATVAQSLSSRTETTAVMSWSSNATVDYIWYSTNNGSSWTGINVADGTSGTYTISGLAANTTYNVKTRVRRKDSQLTTDSSALSITTYAYPYANSMPNFTVGDKLTLGLYNPLKRSITVNILGADNSQCSNDTTTGASITGYNGTGVVNSLLASIPNSKTGTYKVKVTYGSVVTTKTGGTYTVPNAYAPSIGTVSYQDTNSTVTAITGNNQLIVRNQSTVRFTAAGLTAQGGATISAAKVNVIGNNYNLTVSGSSATGGNTTIDSAIDVTATFTVTDSRGLTATKTLSVTMLDWVLPTAIISIERQNNYYSETDITVNAAYSSVDSKNSVTIQARYKQTTASSYSAYVTLQNGVQSTLTLNNLYDWNVQVLIQDRFGSTTYNMVVQKGMPIIYFDRLKSSTGFNCFPKDENSVEINGYNIGRNIITVSLSAAITNLAVNTYTIIPFDLSNVFGDKLTLQSGGGVQIGANVSKVKISALCSYDTINSTGSRHIRIIKNTYTANNTLAWSWQTLVQAQPANVEITPILADVTAGDILYLLYYTGNSADKIGGNTYGCRTNLTVEVIG